MSAVGPFRAQRAPVHPEGQYGEGAGVHAAQGTPWPIEMTDIGVQYVIPGCERRTPPREHSERGER